MIVQLINVNGDPAGLYAYDEEQYSTSDVSERITAAFEKAREDDDPQASADAYLAGCGIDRVVADEVFTDVI